jgi:hypothetical protein
LSNTFEGRKIIVLSPVLLIVLQNTPESSPAFKKISSVPNLYRREASDVYYLLVKRKGHQFRRSLRTTDFALAKRPLWEFESKAERLTGVRVRVVCVKFSKREIRCPATVIFPHSATVIIPHCSE